MKKQNRPKSLDEALMITPYWGMAIGAYLVNPPLKSQKYMVVPKGDARGLAVNPEGTFTFLEEMVTFWEDWAAATKNDELYFSFHQFKTATELYLWLMEE